MIEGAEHGATRSATSSWDERGGERPTLLTGGCRAWPASAFSWRDWRRALGHRRVRLESPGRVGGIGDWDAVLSVFEANPYGAPAEIPWAVTDRIEDQFARDNFGDLGAIDFIDEIDPVLAPRLKWIRAGGTG